MGVKFNTSESSSLNSDYPKSMAVPNQYGFGGLSAHKVISAASTNLDFIKKGGGSVYAINLHNNTSSDMFVRLFDKASAPVNADIPAAIFCIAADSYLDVSLPIGIAFKLGIGMNLTTGSANGNASAVGAGDVVGNIFWK
jgi:hypothetical protein|tara:strand:- start:18825 stop:19244 length:420 start_codon:yes stop_codon:yes gene_type:complete